MRDCEIAYRHKRSGNLIASATAAAVALILALAANAGELERLRDNCARMPDPEKCDAKVTEAEAALEDLCASDPDPEQCRAIFDTAWEEMQLIKYWLLGVLQPAETKAELEYRIPAAGKLATLLYSAGFRLLCTATRQAVESRLDRLEEIRALDETAADAYLRKLANGPEPTIPAIPRCLVPALDVLR